MYRRGFAITFNWIFSIIVGAIIFSFFVYFAVQNTDLFGNITAKQIAWELDNVFSGYQTTLVETSLDFNKPIKLEFKCEELGGEYRENILINGKGKNILRDKIVFAPSGEIESDKFLLWTDEWKVPYKVGTFIYLISPEEKYNIEGDMPKIDIDFLEDSNVGKKIEFRKSSCDRSEVTGKNVIINYQENNGEYCGVICTSSDEYSFYGKSMIYAAIFSDDFGCLYNLMMKKLDLVSKLYDQKAELLNYPYSDDLKTILTNRDKIEDFERFKNDINKIKQDNENRFELNKILLY